MHTTTALLQFSGGLTLAGSLAVLIVSQFEVGPRVSLQRGWLLNGLGGALFGAGLLLPLGSLANLIVLGSGGVLELAGVQAHARWMKKMRR